MTSAVISMTSKEARQQAQAEGLTLLVAENKAGYFGVYLNRRAKTKPYEAQVKRGGRLVCLGTFATAEEAALCVARTPEGKAAAAKPAKPAAAPPLSSEEARQQARAEGLTLRAAGSTTGYFGVYLNKPGQSKPYQAKLRCGGKEVYLGYFATAEEAALCVARTPEGQAAAAKPAKPAKPAAAPPLTSEEARQQAWAEGLTLRAAGSTTGYFGVYLINPGRPKPYKAEVRRGGKLVYLGYFATAEEAALCVARSPEGQYAAERAAAAPPLTSEEALQQAQAEGLTLRKATNGTGFLGVRLDKPGKTKPFQARVTRDGKVVSLGHFVTAEEAALCVARPNQQPSELHSKRQAMAAEERAAAAAVLAQKTSLALAAREALQARTAGMRLLEEAIQCVARSPQGSEGSEGSERQAGAAVVEMDADVDPPKKKRKK